MNIADLGALIMAFECGFKACERGDNIIKAEAEFKKLLKGEI